MRLGVCIGAALGVALLAPAARAADREAIQKAVDGGLAYLKSQQGADGTWQYKEIGATALCGLALLEGGVKPDDPAVQKAAKAVREASVSCNTTYSLSLAIMFLDVLGDRADDELIDSMAVRLLGGQDLYSNGWGYTCPPLNQAEVQRLLGTLQQRRELVTRTEPPAAPRGRATAQDLPREIQQQLQLINQQQAAAGSAVPVPTDNSNTQFAVLALWIARRRGIPIEPALKRIDARFRPAQHPDGGWPYSFGTSTPTMTCSGLLGLALSHGGTLETTLRANPAGPGAPARGGAARDVGNDPAVKKALLLLGSFIGKSLEQIAASTASTGGGQDAYSGGYGRAFYFLFSLERVAVIYGLETIGDKDWYGWGADALLKSQKANGSWEGDYGPTCSDTCFAILFLRRANLAQDLTALLKGRVADPGTRQLRSVDLGNLEKPAAGSPKEAGPAPAAVDPETARLSDELVQADAGRQGPVLRKLRDSKGAAYTDALAHAIHRLEGEVKNKARDALADRLSRMTAATLADKLRDDDAEVRRAAALASAMKDERAHVPRLIELLGDPEPTVARSAHAALKSLAGQDLGPDAAAWKDWWAKNGEK